MVFSSHSNFRRSAVAAVALVSVAGLAFLGSALAEPANQVAMNAATAPAPSTTAATIKPDAADPASLAALQPADHKAMMMRYCTGCHNDKLKTAGMSVVPLDANNLPANLDTWEKILRRVSLGEMPLRGAPRPAKERLNAFTGWLSAQLDQLSAAHPDPGRATVRRMNRVEYANAVRDLLAMNVDSKELPVDDTGYGFDNIADILTVSPTLMDRYINVAGKIARLSVGDASTKVGTTDFKLTKDLFENAFGVPAYNERASDELPLDSRGGGVAKFYAPYDATYTIQVYLNAGTGTETEIDANNRYEVAKVPLKAGLRTIGVYFPKKLALDESLLPKTTTGERPKKPTTSTMIPMEVSVDGKHIQELQVPSVAQGPNVSQAFYLRDVMQISLVGPMDIKGPGDTPSRRKIFVCRPSASLSETACATKILTTLARHAYRRPVTQADVGPLMKIYSESRKDGSFDHGIEAGVQAILVSPNFLFMQEKDPAKSKPGDVHRIADLELATRLSYFLWSSLPDDKLIAVAQTGKLHEPKVLQAQVDRMLADPKAQALTENFAGQWLYLRKLDYQRPDRRIFPDFDNRLRAAMKTETEMFFSGIIRENRPVLDFLDADYTYLNQRLAEHYGIPGVYGTSFRKVQLDPALHRGGLLGQGSILTVTSYNNRTSVVLRGKWILENILSAPPPPPPPNVPTLNATKNGKLLTVREQMEMHRANPVCSSCHTKMDPLGFSLENFNAVGAWRASDAGKLLDVSAVMPDGTKFDGPTGSGGLQGILLSRKDQFTDAFVERLMTYALGRGLEAPDMPAVRKVRYAAAKDNYRMRTVIMGIIQSVPFSMRRTPQT